MTKISVITSTYNRKKELKRAISSVVAQSFADWELIVVDDCSDYDVGKLVGKFSDPRIRLIAMPENSGHDGKPKNVGIKEAKGEYVAFLDDDDEYRPDALKILLRYAEETGRSVIYGDYLMHGRNGGLSPGWSVEFSISRLMRQNFISMCTVLMRADAVRAIGGFDEKVPKFKDWNLWIRLHKNGESFFHVAIPITEVHVTDDCISERFLSESDPETGLHKPTYFDPVDCRVWPDTTSLGEGQPLKIAVYTMTDGRLDYLKRMAESADKLASFPFDWFVCANGGALTDGSLDWLLAQDRKKGKVWRRKLSVIEDKRPDPTLAKEWNLTVKTIREEGKYDIIVKADDDAIFLSEGWLKAMAGVFERNMRVCLSPSVEGLEGLPGGVLRQRSDGGSPYLMVNDQVLGLVPHLGGLVYATPTRIWSEGFTFPEGAEGNMDVLLSQYARTEGYSLFYMETEKVSHGPRGSAGQKIDYPKRNR